MWLLLLLLTAVAALDNNVVYTIQIPKHIVSSFAEFLAAELDLLDIENRDRRREEITGSVLCVNRAVVELQILTASNSIFSLSTEDGCIEMKRRLLLSEDNSALVYAGLGSLATITVLLLLLLCYRYCCRRASTKPAATTPKQQQNDPDLEMTPLTTTQPERAPTPPSAPTPTKDQQVDFIASHFELNCKIPAASFEKHWSTGQVVEVWGCTLKHTPPIGDALNPYMLRLRLLLIASGCVGGVEKMYWAGMKKSGGTLGMIEISTDLQSKRLSAVFKLSRSSEEEDQTCFRNLFNEFKHVVSTTTL